MAAPGYADPASSGAVRAVPPQLLALLRAHGAEQKGEREKAAQLWHDEGWVFTSPTGEPLKYHPDFPGWSSAEMAARYQHVTDTIRQEVAR